MRLIHFSIDPALGDLALTHFLVALSEQRGKLTGHSFLAMVIVEFTARERTRFIHAADSARRAIGFADVLQENARRAGEVRAAAKIRNNAAVGVIDELSANLIPPIAESFLSEGQKELSRSNVEEGRKSEHVQASQVDRIFGFTTRTR